MTTGLQDLKTHSALTDLPVYRVGEQDFILLGRVDVLSGRATGFR